MLHLGPTCEVATGLRATETNGNPKPKPDQETLGPGHVTSILEQAGQRPSSSMRRGDSRMTRPTDSKRFATEFTLTVAPAPAEATTRTFQDNTNTQTNRGSAPEHCLLLRGELLQTNHRDSHHDSSCLCPLEGVWPQQQGLVNATTQSVRKAA